MGFLSSDKLYLLGGESRKPLGKCPQIATIPSTKFPVSVPIVSDFSSVTHSKLCASLTFLSIHKHCPRNSFNFLHQQFFIPLVSFAPAYKPTFNTPIKKYLLTVTSCSSTRTFLSFPMQSNSLFSPVSLLDVVLSPTLIWLYQIFYYQSDKNKCKFSVLIFHELRTIFHMVGF